MDQLTLSHLCILASTYFYLTYLWNFLIFLTFASEFCVCPFFFWLFAFSAKSFASAKKRTEVLIVNLKPFSRTACVRGAVCPLCFFFGEGGERCVRCVSFLGRAACARCCFWCMYITRVQPATCRIETEAMLSLCYLCYLWSELSCELFTPLRVGWPPTPQVYFGP